ncbi:MAG: hypothetical protein V1859_07840 [archaeon]
MKLLSDIFKKWHILFKITPLLLILFAVKIVFHIFNLEIISLNALFTSLIAATTFLIGFLITGVISDYKESERIPGDLASGLEAIYDDAYILNKKNNSNSSKRFLNFHVEFIGSIIGWFYKKERTSVIMDKVSRLNDFFAEIEKTKNCSTARMRQEQNNIRKIIIRVHTIRETCFVQSAYAIAEALAFFFSDWFSCLKA